MTAPASLEDQLAAEQLAKRRRYVLANTRARWAIIGFAVVLLATLRLAHVVPLSWGFLAVFVGAAAAVQQDGRAPARGARRPRAHRAGRSRRPGGRSRAG